MCNPVLLSVGSFQRESIGYGTTQSTLVNEAWASTLRRSHGIPLLGRLCGFQAINATSQHYRKLSMFCSRRTKLARSKSATRGGIV